MLNNHKTLSIQNDGELMIVKFPVRTFTFVFSLLVVLALAIIPVFLPPDFFGDRRTPILGISYYFCIAIFNVYYFIQFYTRKLVINKRERTIIYKTFFKRVFKIDDIEKMEIKTHDSGEGGTTYSLAVYVRNKRFRIKIDTESSEQSLLLKEEIQSFINESERR